MEKRYIKNEIYSLANSIKESILRDEVQGKELHIFLCGGNSAEQRKKRFHLGKEISEGVRRSKYSYNVHYPEKMFFELLASYNDYNLLGLENTLAKSVHLVALFPESPGTYTELGAFSNSQELRDKLFVMSDERYQNKKSFINDGPLRLLKKETKSKILYTDFTTFNYKEAASKIRKAAVDLGKLNPPVYSLENPISSGYVILGALFVFEPIRLELLQEIFDKEGDGKGSTGIKTAANVLIREGKVLKSDGKLKLSPYGFDSLFKDKYSLASMELKQKLYNLRLRGMNLFLRKRGVSLGCGVY